MLLKIWSVLLLQHFGTSQYLVCQLNNGDSCPKAVCPNTALNFICNIETTQQLGFTVWLLPNGTCTNKQYTDRIALLQPKYGGCNPNTSSQHDTCGPFTAQNVASSGCVNSLLPVVATQGLNGTEIKCMNYNGSSYFPVGNASILIMAAPDTPNISVVPSCTEVAVHWSVSSLLLAEGEPTSVTVSVTTGTVIIQANNTSTTSTSLTFHNLVSDSFYTITVVASNCAGRSYATIDIWTLPSPPQNVHGNHVVSSQNTVHLRVTWTPVVGNNKLAYVLKVSSKADLIFNQVPVSSDHCGITTCYFMIDFNATNTSVFLVSMATVSDSRTGPFSDVVESVVEQSSKAFPTFLWFCLALLLPLLLLFVVSCCVCFKKHKQMVTSAPSVLVASVLCHISRRSKESSHIPISHVDKMGNNKKMEEGVLELKTNTAYGTHVTSNVHEVGTNKKMEGDVMEIKANTSYVPYVIN